MRNKILSLLLVALTLGSSGCSDEFTEMNQNPDNVNDINPGYLLTRMWMRYNGSKHEEHRGNLIMAGPLSGLVQSGYRNGQGFDGTNDGFNEAKMIEMYNDAIRHGVQAIKVLEADKSQDNAAKIAATKIGLQFQFQRVTDLYGDVPYFEAGLGYHDQIFYPKYDSQEIIYKSTVDTLKKYRDVLLTTTAAPYRSENDIIMGGVSESSRNAEWARLANSLILRMGMRGVNGDAEWAQSTVEEAANHTAGFVNSAPVIMPTGDLGGDWGMIVNGAGVIINEGGSSAHVGEEWLRMAQQNRDPRLFYVAAHVERDGGRLKVWDSWMGKTDLSGNDISIKFDAFAEAARPGEPWKPVSFTTIKGGGTESYSTRGVMVVNKTDGTTEKVFGQWEINPTRTDAENMYYTMAALNPEAIGNRVAPIVLFGADESYFILAEAKLLGWNVPGSVEENMQRALEISMAKYPQLYGALSDSPQKYIEYQSLNETGDKKALTYDMMAAAYVEKVMTEEMSLQVIWRERWKSLMSAQGGYEAFALWNRTNLELKPGFPSTGISYPGTREMEMPVYNGSDVASDKLVFGQAITPLNYSLQPFHTGGSTEGWRPRRINYPNSELANNGANIQEAINRQINLYGQVGSGSHFITTHQWYSKKD